MNSTSPGEVYLSAIKIFGLIEDRIKKIATFPLNSRNIVIQQDAYKRLGQSGDPGEEELLEVFATVEQGRKETDNDLRFMAQFTEQFLLLSIESIGDLSMDYTDLGRTNEAVADQIVTTLVMLANGQLSCIHTIRNGRVCAVELVYRENPTSMPTTISIEGNYPRFLGSDDPDRYEVHVLQNSFHIAPVTMPKKFFLHAQRDDGSRLTLNRTFVGGAISPLTKTQYKTIITEVSNALVGVENDDQFTKKVNGSWVLWLSFAILTIPIFAWVPANIFPYAGPIAGLGAFFVASFLTGRYLVYVENMRLSNPNHPLLKLDQKLTFHNFLSFLLLPYRLSLGATIISLWFPIYITKTDRALVRFFDLAAVLSPLIFLPVMSLGLALLFSLSTKGVLRAMSAILSLLAIAGIFVINFGFTYTGDDAATPEPQTTVAILAYLGLMVLSIILLIVLARKSEAEVQSSLHSASLT